MIIIEEILSSKKSWKKLYKSCNVYVQQNIGKEGCFDTKIKFKFHKSDMFSREMKINHFITHMIVWSPFIKLKIEKLDSSYIIPNINNLTNATLEEYYNTKYIEPFIFDSNVHHSVLNLEIAKVTEKMKKISEDYSLLLGVSGSNKDIIDAMNEDESIRELIYYKPPKGQPKEVEDDYNEKGEILINKLQQIEGPFKYLLRCGEAINKRQFIQYMLCVGYQSDINGMTFPQPIESSFFNKGLQTPSEYFIDANSGTKSLIFNGEYTGMSGYFLIRLAKLAANTNLEQNSKFVCDTKYLIEYKVKSQQHLDIINGLYFKEKKNSLWYSCINCKSDNSKIYIGKTIYIRTPLTCTCEDGKICKKCYGRLYNINNDINVGIFGAEEIASKVMQEILSAKHLITTNSSIFVLCSNTNEAKKYITLDGNTIKVSLDENVNTNKVFITFTEDDVELVSSEDGDIDDNEVEFSKYISKFNIKSYSKSKSETIDTVKEVTGNSFYMLRDTFKQFTQHVIINSSNEEIIEYRMPIAKAKDKNIFYVEITSAELTKPLKKIIELIDKKQKVNGITLEEYVEQLSDLFCESKITYPSALVHMLTAVKEVVRGEDGLSVPDFSNKENMNKYIITTIKNALYNNRSIINSLAFEKLGQLLTNPESYEKKGKSILDTMFYEKF